MTSNFIYHNGLFHSVLLSSIYPISYEIAKKTSPEKGFTVFENCKETINANIEVRHIKGF